MKVSEKLKEWHEARREAKGEKRTVMSIICRPSDLTEWKRQAKANNMTLTQWVTRSLNNETK